MGEFRALFLPYCLDQQSDGRYAVLNRNYKPVGLAVEEWVNYADHPGCCVYLPGLTPGMAVQLSARGRSNLQRIYLYNDGCVPTQGTEQWDAYQERLRLLAGLAVE